MKKTFTFIVFGILILALFVIGKQPAGFRRELENRDRILRGQIDSLNALIETTMAERARIEIRLGELKDSLKIQTMATEAQRRRYLDLKNRPAKRFTDPPA